MRGRALIGRVVVSLACVACGDTAVAPPAPITARIVAFLPNGPVTSLDPIRVVGEAGAPDLGPLPDSSLLWYDNDRLIGRGRELEFLAEPGDHVIRLFARHDGRAGDDRVTIAVEEAALGSVRWSVPLSGKAADALAIGPGEVVYTTEAFDVLVAIERDGSVRWRRQLPGYGRWVPPAIAPDGAIIVPFPYWNAPDTTPFAPGGVVALNPDGSTRWVWFTADHSPPGKVYYHVHGGVAVDAEGRVYVGSEERVDVVRWALSPAGEVLWRTEAGVGYDTWSHTVLAADSLVLTMPRRDSTAVLSSATGEVRWFAPSPWINYCTVAPGVGADGAIYYGSRASASYTTEYRLAAVGPEGAVRWMRALPGPFVIGSPVVGPDRIYLGSASGGVMVLSLDGDSLATYGPALTWFGDVLTLGANGVTYVMANDTLFSYDAVGNRRFAAALPIAVDGSCYVSNGGPVIGDDGTVYVRTRDAVVALRDTVGPATDAPWPTLQGSFRRAGRRATDY